MAPRSAESEKQDLQRAQEIMHRALIKIAKTCGLRHDPATFIVIVMAAYSRVAAEIASDARVVEPGGIEAMIKFAQDNLGKMMREDFDQRLTAMAAAQTAASKH